MSEQTIKQKHEQYADIAKSKLAMLSNDIKLAVDALQWLINYNDEDTQMLLYIQEGLRDTSLRYKAILANIDKLCELADPTGLEDLPF